MNKKSKRFKDVKKIIKNRKVSDFIDSKQNSINEPLSEYEKDEK